MPKSFHKYTRGTKSKALRIAKRMHTLCLSDESNGHGIYWFKGECQEMMFLAMDQLAVTYNRNYAKSWFSKVRKATQTRDTDNIYIMPPLDLGRDDEGRICYIWLRNGELPSGFLRHLASISQGLSPAIFDDLISLAGSSSDELIEKVGAKMALLAVIEARKTAYFLHKGDELEQFLYVLSGLEGDISTSLDRETWDAGQEFMTKQLPAPIRE